MNYMVEIDKIKRKDCKKNKKLIVENKGVKLRKKKSGGKIFQNDCSPKPKTLRILRKTIISFLV